MSLVTLVGRREHARAAQTLRRLLPRLVVLSLNLRQAQWNLTGPAAPSIRAVKPEIDIAVAGWADDVAGWADDVAELTVALGHPVDARPSVAVAVSAPFRPGRVTGCDALEQLAADLRSTGQTIRRELTALGDLLRRVKSSSRIFCDGFRRRSLIPQEADVSQLATGLLAAEQGGYLLAQTSAKSHQWLRPSTWL